MKHAEKTHQCGHEGKTHRINYVKDPTGLRTVHFDVRLC